MDINLKGIIDLEKKWSQAQPFSHVVIDNFLPQDIAEKVAEEFPDANSDFWYEYANPLEIKKACSDWNKFPHSIYQVFNALVSDKVEHALSILTKKKVVADCGLHGGGLHCHKAGGKLNTHLDYSLHPKLNLQRKVQEVLINFEPRIKLVQIVSNPNIDSNSYDLRIYFYVIGSNDLIEVQTFLERLR